MAGLIKSVVLASHSPGSARTDHIYRLAEGRGEYDFIPCSSHHQLWRWICRASQCEFLNKVNIGLPGIPKWADLLSYVHTP